MKLTLILTGKTASKEISSICDDYTKRISRFATFDIHVVDAGGSKSQDTEKSKKQEAAAILKKISATDHVILLDSNGKEFSSPQFAAHLESLFNQSIKNICFVVGGAYGFAPELYARANAKLSLSKMTFSHQIVRAIFLEQLYRAFAIINKTGYHHE